MFNPVRPQSKAVQRLSPAFVQKAGPGMHHDGAGLYLHVGPNGGKSWCFRYQMGGQPRVMGLGPYPEIGLARAREKALEARRLKAEGVDPLANRDAKRDAAKTAATAAAMTFRACAEKYIAAHEAGWRNAVHRAQWGSTLATYAYDVIGDLPAAAVETGHVTRILEPIWAIKTETASRLRGRIEAVLDYAKTHGWRTGENPARWKGHLENVLPRKAKVAKMEHHAALPWREAGTFMAVLV
jgi:Arm DNA-binding domain